MGGEELMENTEIWKGKRRCTLTRAVSQDTWASPN